MLTGCSPRGDRPLRLVGLGGRRAGQQADQPRGLVHAVTNATAIGLFGASLVARRTGERGKGKLLGLVAGGVLAAGGYLGGHLTYVQGIRVETVSPAA